MSRDRSGLPSAVLPVVAPIVGGSGTLAADEPAGEGASGRHRPLEPAGAAEQDVSRTGRRALVLSNLSRENARGLADVLLVGLGQLPSSLSNFLPGLIVAARLPADQFGRFSAVYAAVLVGLESARAGAIQPLQIQLHRSTWLPLRRMGMSIVVASGAAAISFVLYGASLITLVAATLGVAAITVQEYCRQSALTAKRPLVAGGLDMIWLVAACLLTAVFPLSWGAEGATAAWMVPGIVAGLVGLAVVRTRGTKTAMPKAQDTRRLGVPNLTSFWVISVAGQLPAWALAWHNSWSALGDMRHALLFLAPLGVVQTIAVNFILPRSAEIRSVGRATQVRLLLRSVGLILLASFAWGLVLLALAWLRPDALSPAGWAALPWLWLAVAFGSVATPATLLLLAFRDARGVLVARIVSLTCTAVVLVWFLAYGTVDLGSAVAMLVTAWLTVTVALAWVLIRSWRRTPSAPMPS